MVTSPSNRSRRQLIHGVCARITRGFWSDFRVYAQLGLEGDRLLLPAENRLPLPVVDAITHWLYRQAAGAVNSLSEDDGLLCKAFVQSQGV